ncbi:MAG: aspartate--tRNA ligase [PVC group bacterium]
MKFQSRTYCGSLRKAAAGRRVLAAGWVDALRDHGNILFVHLRDRSGIIQVVFNPDKTPGVRAEAGRLKEEYCVAVRGEVVVRRPGSENPALETGEVEIIADELTILNPSPILPFPISEKAMVAGGAVAGDAVGEDLRLQYRYLDLRRPSMQENLVRRYRIIKCARDFLDSREFVEIETPVLTKSTPEGARDYLVPSRVHPGCFYALPQSPQLFKQILMFSGFERYFQVVRCYRDEDLRPNRQPEFTQLDIEAAFIDEEFIYELLEELTVRMFAVGGIDLPRPFPRLPYREAIDSFGTDRPDLRFGLRFIEATDIFSGTGYAVFRKIIEQGGLIKGINVRGQSAALSKNILQNEYAQRLVPEFGARGMTWMRVAGDTLESNIVRFFTAGERTNILERFGAGDGDVILMIADQNPQIVTDALGRLRLHLGNRLGLIPEGEYRPVWITDFPLFEAAEDGLTSRHHPFTAPDRDDFDPGDREDLLSLRSRAYDLVVNGEELGGGSIRINSADLQARIFRALGLEDTVARERFGFFLDALKYGAPPHGGIALGLDRVTAMILGAPSIREVIAFPKNRAAACPLTGAPSPVDREQLRELNLADAGERSAVPAPEDIDLVSSLSWVSRIGIREGERSALEAAVGEAKDAAERAGERAGEEEPLYSPIKAGGRERTGRDPRVHPLARDGSLLKGAPSAKNGYFKVPAILE